MWIPALGQVTSVPILVAFLLWPVSDQIALPAFMADLGVDAIPFGFVLSFFGSIRRLAAMEGNVSLLLSLVLGRGGSSSRMILNNSSNAAERSRVLSNGVSPVSSS